MDTSTKNGIITVAALAVAGVIVWKLLKNPNNSNSGGNSGGGDNGGGDNGGGDNGGGDNGGGNGGGENPPPPPPSQTDLTGNQVMKIANDLFEAMDDYGTDWDSTIGITTSFKKIKTNNDMDNLMSAFGTRTLNCGTGNIFCSDFTGNLKECLRDELDEDEISEVNAILRSNGVSRSI